MKSINEYTLQECIERLRELPDGTVDDACDKVMLPHLPWIFDVAVALADRIHELTRWIPVEERLPDESDANEKCLVLTLYSDGYVETWMPRHIAFNGTTGDIAFTHWRRINPPEGV